MGTLWRKSDHGSHSPLLDTPAGRAAAGRPGGPRAAASPRGDAHHVEVRSLHQRNHRPRMEGRRRRGRHAPGAPQQGRERANLPLHPDLASLFTNWPTPYGLRDTIVGPDAEDGAAPPEGRHRARGPRRGIARNRSSESRRPQPATFRLGHANPEVTLRIYLPILGSTHTMADVP